MENSGGDQGLKRPWPADRIIHVGINCDFLVQETNNAETLTVHCESQTGEYWAPFISIENRQWFKNIMKYPYPSRGR